MRGGGNDWCDGVQESAEECRKVQESGVKIKVKEPADGGVDDTVGESEGCTFDFGLVTLGLPHH
jgi:hypothetical protein